MEFTIHVNVTGLDKLAECLAALAGKTANPAHLVPSLPAMRGAPGSVAPQPVSVVQYNAAPPQNAAPNPALTAKDAPSNVAPRPAGVATQPVSVAPQPGTAQNVPPAPAPTAPAAPAGAKTYTLDEIAQPAGTWLGADPAKTAERSAALNALNAEFGIMGLNQLPPEQYGAYALRLRQLGVAI